MNIKKVERETIEATINQIFAEQNIQYFEETLEKNPEDIAIGAYDGNTLIGGIIAKKQYQNIHISQLAVHDDYRGQQVGTQLLQEIEIIAKTSDIINLTLTTRSYQAVDFYKKLGFTVYAKLEDMPMRGVTKVYFNKRLLS